MSVPTFVVKALFEAAEEARPGGRAFLLAAGFEPERLENVDERLSQDEYDSLVERALDFTCDPALGLRVGAGAKSLMSSLPAHLVLQAASLREGLDLAARYYRLLADEPPYTLEEHAREIVIKVVGAKGPPRCRRYGAELAAAGIYRAI